MALKNPSIAVQLINKGYIKSVTGNEKVILAEILDLISRDSNIKRQIDSARLSADALFIDTNSKSKQSKSKNEAGEINYLKEIERRLAIDENVHR